MALPPTKIRYSKKGQNFIVVVGGFILFVHTFIIFFTGASKAGLPMYLGYFASALIVVVICTILLKRFKDPRPVLVFRSDGLLLPRKNDRFIAWGSMTYWKINTYKNSHRLVIYTAGGKTSLDISWLDRPVKHIEELMATYIRQPGPGGFQR